MSVINCKNCGGSIALSEDRTFGTCDFCGSTMTFPKVSDDQRASMFNRGNHFRRIGEFDKALAVYERIVQEDDDDAEAHWCCALCRFGIEYVEDPASFEWLPTCHRASFDSFLEDVDYLAALEHSEGLTQRQYRKEAAKIAEVQRGILATSQNTDPYDVFICYKETDEQGQRTRDSLMAQDIYYQLTEQGRKVFFARITLEDIAGTQYEPYIFAALNSAKVMVAVGTRPEHFSAVWVKNEWSRFLAMMRKDRSKLLLPCYAGMDPYDLPEQLSVLQSYDMTRIGFIQDLTRGISKVLDADKKPEPAPAAPAPVRESAPVNNNIVALLKRGRMALEDGDWSRADGFYEEVLNQDAECAEAYLGKALAAAKVPTVEALAERRPQSYGAPAVRAMTLTPDREWVAAAVEKYYIPLYMNKVSVQAFFAVASVAWEQRADSAVSQRAQEEHWWDSNKDLLRAAKFGGPELEARLAKARAAALKTMDERIAVARDKDRLAEAAAREKLDAALKRGEDAARASYEKRESTRDNDYDIYSRRLDSETDINQLKSLIPVFRRLGDYKDSAAKADLCQKKIDQILEKEEAERKAQQEARERREKQLKKLAIRAAIALGCALVLALLIWLLVAKLILPAVNYSKAEAYAAQGDTVHAALHYGKAGSYSDAREQSMALWEQAAVRDAVAQGNTHSLRLNTDGTVVAEGNNNCGQCDVTGWSDIVAIAAGGSHSLGLRADGTVVAVGWNIAGQCDVEDWSDIIAIAAGNSHSLGLRADGTVVAVGRNTNGQCDVSGWTDIVAITASRNHSTGIKADGTFVEAG